MILLTRRPGDGGGLLPAAELFVVRSLVAIWVQFSNDFPSLVCLVRNNSYPVHSDYTTFLSRLKSYNSYPPTLFQNNYSLSESGFRYTGVGDIVECFFCGLVLQKWTKDDIPWVEHAK
ncbi:hypothetical protein ACI65C_013418 [Semiaphis heraclei]